MDDFGGPTADTARRAGERAACAFAHCCGPVLTVDRVRDVSAVTAGVAHVMARSAQRLHNHQELQAPCACNLWAPRAIFEACSRWRFGNQNGSHTIPKKAVRVTRQGRVYRRAKRHRLF